MKHIFKFIFIPFAFIFSNLLAENNMIDVVELILRDIHTNLLSVFRDHPRFHCISKGWFFYL